MFLKILFIVHLFKVQPEITGNYMITSGLLLASYLPLLACYFQVGRPDEMYKNQLKVGFFKSGKACFGALYCYLLCCVLGLAAGQQRLWDPTSKHLLQVPLVVPIQVVEKHLDLVLYSLDLFCWMSHLSQCCHQLVLLKCPNLLHIVRRNVLSCIPLICHQFLNWVILNSTSK